MKVKVEYILSSNGQVIDLEDYGYFDKYWSDLTDMEKERIEHSLLDELVTIVTFKDIE